MAEFRGPKGSVSATANPLLKAALVSLAEIWPQAMSLDLLRSKARARLGWPEPNATGSVNEARTLAMHVLELYASNLVELHVHPPHFVREIRLIACRPSRPAG